jgi:hypothetical protein
MIWAGEHYVCMRFLKVQVTYTRCAEQHCCQHFRKSLALKVLHMSVSMPAIGEPHTYNLALGGLAHLLKHLFRHGGAGEMDWRLAGDGRDVIRTACCVLPRVTSGGVVFKVQPSAVVVLRHFNGRCGSLAAIKGTRRDHQRKEARSRSEDWAALEHDTPRNFHACEVPYAAPVAQTQSERHQDKLDPDHN